MNETRFRESESRLWRSKGLEPRERVVHLRALNQDIRVQEVGEGTPALFVHGGNISGSSWASLVAGLDGLRCIVIDRPGCGLSAPLASPLSAASLPGFADSLVVDVLDALEIDAAHLVGTSFGGYVVLRAAATHPGRIRSLVEFSWPFGASRRLPAWMRMLSVPGVAPAMRAMPVNRRSIHAIFRSIGHQASLRDGRITTGDIEWFLSLLRDTDTLKHETVAVGRLISPLRGIVPSALLDDQTLNAIEAPVRFIWGENDPFGGAAAARAFVKRVPRAELQLLPGAGHAPWLDEPERCRASVSQFLGGQRV